MAENPGTAEETGPLLSDSRSCGSLNNEHQSDEWSADAQDTRCENQPVPRVNTNSQTMMHMIKGNLGTGILAMGKAVSYAGLWAGSIGLLLIGIVCIHGMHLLARCNHHLCEVTGQVSMDYGQVAEQAFANGPRPTRRLQTAARITVNIFLFITQFGFCTIYILFIAQSIQQVVQEYANFNMSIRVYQAIVLCFLIPLTYIKTLKILAPFAAVANVFTAVGLVMILQYCVRNIPRPVDEFPFIQPMDKLALFFGMAIYSYEGIGVILPIENSMREPRDFRGLTGVLNTSMMLVTILYIAMGFYGYLRFGDNIQGSITLNLPMDNPLYVAVKLMFAAAIYVTYSLQFYVPAVIIERNFINKLPEGACRKCMPYLLRTCLVIFTFLISIIVPHLELMISLIGAFASSALALIIPPILDIVTFWDEGLGICKWRLIKDVAICVCGISGFVVGTFVTMMKIIQTFK